MEVAAAASSTPTSAGLAGQVAALRGGPFQREVREWQHVDPNTGALLTGRLEADRWVNGPLNSYGKMVSHNLSTPDGSTQHTQKKQMEILQARTASGSLQVVRAQTVQTTSSRWSSSTLHSEICSNGVSTSTTSTSSSSFSNGHSIPAITANSTSSSHRTSALTTNGFSSHHLQQHFLTRGKSVSIEDLSTERDETNFDDDVEPTQWKRVSKIRRSLQFPRKTAPKISTRPADLPENSVSVSKIRQELENGRRLNTAMRNNHIDFVALDNILNSVSESCPSKAEAPRTPTTPKANTTSFLTAESLKEIRGKLRRLSNESLYRDDMSPGDDRKEDDDSVTITEVETRMGHLQTSSSSDSYKSNSLESTRKGSTDSNSEDWHSRRKSYGFERMSHPSDFMAKMDSSTDSGIGRSTDLSSSWSSGGTDNTAASRGTVVTLGDQKEKSNNPAMVIKITNENQESAKTSYKEEEIKRHSIAVDETSYVRDSLKTMFEKKTSVSVNGFSQIFLDDLSKNRKKVEFCKTEVHFTADSGRVNIVETDEKPPPTNNFRRRRRSSGGSIGSSYLQAISSGVPVTHFGDLEKGVNEADLKDNPVYAAPPVVTTTVGRPEPSPRKVFTTSDDSDGQSADDISLRGILKNKPVKPKPYVLGENLESSDSLWGVKLRPVSTELNYWNEETEEKPQTTEEKEVTSSGNFSTKINLSQPAPSWTPDECPESNPKSTTKILIDMTKSSNASEQESDQLKSTSLIMRTLRSANQFDEAMQKLETARRESLDSNGGDEHRSAFQLISSTIAKSNSASSIFKDTPKLRVAKYAASLDGDLDDDESRYQVPMPAARRSFTNESRLLDFEAYISKNSVRRSSTDEFSSVSMVSNVTAKPVAAPRMKKLGSNVLSHQLTQLKRLYDAAEQYDSDDSAKADEEVKLYLGNLAGGSVSEEKGGSELSGSWSRIKAKRNIQKYRDQDVKITVNSTSEFEIVKPSSNGISTTTITSEKQSKTSNIMSIALKSPTPTKKHTAPSPVKATQPQSIEPTQSLSPHFKRHISNAASDTTNGTARNEERASLRLSSGARQLREHELSFFGVNRKQEPAKSSNTTASSSTKPATNTTFTRSTTLTSSFIKRNSINMNPLSTSTSTASTSSNSTTNPAKPHTTAAPTTWQLTNDKPDLLRHSQRVDAIKKTTSTSSTATSLGTSTSTMSSLDPHYENLNLVKPTAMANSTVPSYDRKQDLKRDEQILEELTRAADEILNVVNNMSNAESTESILNEQYRGSGGSGVTLGTIRECSTTNKIMRSRGVQVSKNFDDSLKRHQRSTRVSSASSNESLQRPSPTRTSTANTSLRTGQHPPETRSTTTGSGRRKLTSSSTESRRLIRMCSKERLHQSNASSSEDLPNAASVEPPRRPRRTRYHSSQTGEKSEKDSPRLSASKTSTSDSRRSDERLSSRSHRSERSSTRTSKGPTSGTLASNGVIPTAGVEQQHRIRSKSGASVLQTTYVLQSFIVPPPRRRRRRDHPSSKAIVRRHSSRLRNMQSAKRATDVTKKSLSRRSQLDLCICQ
ncbi:AAEL003348-PC [Aedes aegypti]|uniref:AAEL003348-PC n=1 Tax=Aedes aegypti TaxID=7159 RepID=J9HYC0_AEDAE|nr:AAEL003348-PC [Aedes aegypti]